MVEAHTGVVQRAPAFAVLALCAAGHRVAPGVGVSALLAALPLRHDMIHRRLARVHAHTAILAGVLVADQRATPRPGRSAPWHADIAAQAQDAGERRAH